jgi:hypothetical protein
VFAGNPPLYQHAQRGHQGAPGAEESLRDPTPERPKQASWAGLYARRMAEKDKASGMKSAYELALERLEKQGIERPREEALSENVRARMGEARRQAEAKLAELEILHQNRLKTVWEPDKRQEEEEEYVRERRRIEEERDRKIEKLRG